MRNHKQMFEALLAGEVLTCQSGCAIKLIDGNINVITADPGNETIYLKENPFLRQDWTIKPKTININGFEVPEPIREPLNFDEIYYITVANEHLTFTQEWRDTPRDIKNIEAGIAHKTKEAAELHAKALLSFTKKE